MREQENEGANKWVLMGLRFEKVHVPVAGDDLATATELQKAGWGSA